MKQLRTCTEFKRDTTASYECCDTCHHEQIHEQVFSQFRMKEYQLCCAARAKYDNNREDTP